MRKYLVIGVVAALLLVIAALVLSARAILATDTARRALESQLSRALGQPVHIGTIDASIYPRLTVNLGDVTIGDPPRIQARALHIGTSLGALLSRRIEGARIRLDQARIELPLPDFGTAADQPADAPADEPAVEIVSVDEIALTDVEVVSGGRTLRGSIEAQLEGQAVTLSRVELAAGEETITASGRISDLNGPIGEIDLEAGLLNLDNLIAFASDFAAGATPTAEGSTPAGSAPAAPTPGAAPSAMKLTVTLDAERATMGALRLDGLTGRALVTGSEVTLDPVKFNVFNGTYDGRVSVTLEEAAPEFQWQARLSGVNIADAMAFAGQPNTVSGTLAAQIDIAGRGADAAAAIRTVRGTARIDATDGVVKNLGLVRGIVIATSMRADAPSIPTTTDEPFSTVGATLAIGGGSATTDDLLFESENLRLQASGRLRLDGSEMNFSGKVQLSEKLTAEAGRDLVRYTQEGGRVTLPASITGSVAAPHVTIDVAGMAGRAIRNRAQEEAEKAIKKGLGGLIRR